MEYKITIDIGLGGLAPEVKKIEDFMHEATKGFGLDLKPLITTRLDLILKTDRVLEQEEKEAYERIIQSQYERITQYCRVISFQILP